LEIVLFLSVPLSAEFTGMNLPLPNPQIDTNAGRFQSHSMDECARRTEFAGLLKPCELSDLNDFNAEGAAPQDVKLSTGESVDGAT